MSAERLEKQVMNDLATFEPDEESAAQALRAEKALAWAKAFTIVDDESYTRGGQAVAQCKDRWDLIEKRRVYLKAPHLEGARRLDGFFMPKLNMLKEAERIIKDKRAKHRREEEAKHRKAERVRAVEQAGIVRAAAAEAAAKAKSQEEAQAIQTKAMLETPAPVPSTIPKNDGLSISTTYKGECVSITELAMSCVDTPSNASFLLINQSTLNSRAREQGALFLLPGCKRVKIETEKRGRR